MKKAFFTLILLAAVAAGIYFLTNSETRRIRRQFIRLAEAVSKESGEGNIVMVVKMQTLGALLGERVSVHLREYPFDSEQSNGEIVSLATRCRTYFKHLSVRIIEVEVEMLDKDVARCRCSARVDGVATHQNYHENRYFDAELVKQEGKWRFVAFQEDQLLKR